MSSDAHARIERATKESKVLVEVDLDGTGRADVSTGVGFYDHMLDAFARHSLIDLTVQTEGDTHIDAHHTVEDTAIALGDALREALGDKPGIRRFGDALVPLDEALVQCAVDVSGRPYCVHTGEPDAQAFVTIGGTGRYLGSLTRHVFETLAFHAQIALHVRVLSGRDPHHLVEAQFKAVARALRDAVALDPRETGRAVHQGQPVTGSLASSSSTTARATSARPCAPSSAPAPTVTLTADRAAAMDCDGLVVPGVGAFAACVDGLRAVKGHEVIGRRLAGGRPVLGICVGMQVLFAHGVEHGDDTPGLDEWPGVVERLQAPVVPHMGWNTVEAPEGTRLFDGVEDERFYFVHSYGVRDWVAAHQRPDPSAAGDLGRRTAATGSSPRSRTAR